MKILCVADHIDPLVYSSHIKERFKDVDMVFGAGDLPMEYLGFIASTLNKPVLFIFGNHNLRRLELFHKSRTAFYHMAPEDISTNLYGSTHIDNTVVHQKGLLVAGLGGSYKYNNGENQFTEFQMRLKILKMIPGLLFNKVFRGRYLDILLTHAAPFGVNDKEDPCHRGFKAFLWFMRVFKPRYLLHGHIHLYSQNENREAHYHQTAVINVYDHFVLKL